LFETPQACGVFVDRADICLKDHVLRGGGTAHLREPPQVGRAPGGTARIADILPQQEGFEPELGGLEIPEGFVFDLWNLDGSEVPRAHEPRQLYGVTTVGVDPVARLFRNQGRGDDPALLSFFSQVAIEPIPARAGFVDKHQVLTFRLQLTDE
jgi:hypothetical protein